MDSSSSCRLAAGSLSFLTITERPETEVATFLVRILFRVKTLRMASATESGSRMDPPSTASGSSGSNPARTSSKPARTRRSSTTLTALDPRSRPARDSAAVNSPMEKLLHCM